MLGCLRFVGVGAAGIGGIGPGFWHREQFAGSGDVVGAGGAGEQAVVADAMEAVRQDVGQEAADELICCERNRPSNRGRSNSPICFGRAVRLVGSTNVPLAGPSRSTRM